MSIDATRMSACDGNVNIFFFYFMSQSFPWSCASTDMAGQTEDIHF